MKLFQSFYHRVLLPSCLYFTLLCFTFSLLLSTSETEMTLPTINLGNLVQIYLFCLLFALSNLLFSHKKLRFGGALVCHFLLFLLNIALIFFVIGGHYQTVSGAFRLLLLFALIYVILAAVAATARHLLRTARHDDSDYKKQFR